jgi:Phage capsid family
MQRSSRAKSGSATGLTPALLTRAAVAPADTSTSGWASQLAGKAVASFIASLAPESAAAKLMQAGTFINMDGVAELTVPWPSTNPQPAFVAEGGAIPVAQGALTGVTLGPPSKLAAIEAFTRELAAHSVDAAEVVIGDLMRAAATQALDGAVFSTTAASTTRPAGILNGVSAIAATGGGGAAAMLADIDALISAIVTAGGGRSIMFFASPGRAVRLRALAGIDLGLPITPTPTLTGTTLVAVEAGGFASGFGSDPNISIAAATALHFESSAPQAIGLSGSTTVPVWSLWQWI